MKNILFILRNHFTNDSRVLKEAQSLANNGYKVTIRCLWDKDLLKKENIDGFVVERVCYSDRSKRKNFFYKLFTFFKFSLLSIKNVRSFDVVHCHDLDGLLVGVMAKALSFGKVQLVYDAHEYETERVGFSPLQKKVLFTLESFLIKFAAKVICVSEGIAKEYVKNYGIEHPQLILNCPRVNKDENKYNYFRERFKLTSDQIIFLYQGVLGPSRGVELIIKAFKELNDPKKVIVFMGYGHLYNYVDEACKTSDNMYLHEAVSPSVLLKYTASADVGMVLIENSCLSYYYCLPNKLFEYTQSNLPVIVSDLPELKKVVDQYNNGIVVKEDYRSIVDVVDNVTFDNIKRYNKNIPEMKKIFNWGMQEVVLLDIYKQL